MSDPYERIKDCREYEPTKQVSLTLLMLPALLYLSMMAYTMRKHKLVAMNRVLAYGWAVEAALQVIFALAGYDAEMDAGNFERIVLSIL